MSSRAVNTNQPRHPTWSLSFRERAQLPDTPALAAYLLHLIAIKKSNLCVSADVSTSSQLLKLADETGDSICILKTHADIVDDWSERTVRKLREIAKKKKFLVFEDRKFGDIGSTVQRQYTSGPLGIVKWAEIVNAHIFPGPAVVTALKQAAQDAVALFNSSVSTEISVGSPAPEANHSDEDSGPIPSDAIDSTPAYLERRANGSEEHLLDEPLHDMRKGSIVSITTTISAKTEPISPQPTPMLDTLGEEGGLGSTPYLRALLLLAEMSSEGNLMTGAYTQQCVALARQQRDFVIGFVAQHNLNSEPTDNFVTITPGVSMPPPGKEDEKMGDALGQQYNTPRQAVFEHGADVIIVGRGIITADDPAAEAERYRQEAWKAYETRIATRR